MRVKLGGGGSQAISRNVLAKQARVVGKRYGSAVQRVCTMAVSCRLVLTPTGNGSCEHLGETVSMPAPIELRDGVYEVGRAEPADILIRVPTMSSRHALLRVSDDKVNITDLNSTNGTVVNGRELTPMDNGIDLEPGGEIIFGDTFLARFQLEQVAVEAPQDSKEANNAAGL